MIIARFRFLWLLEDDDVRVERHSGCIRGGGRGVETAEEEETQFEVNGKEPNVVTKISLLYSAIPSKLAAGFNRRRVLSKTCSTP